MQCHFQVKHGDSARAAGELIMVVATTAIKAVMALLAAEPTAASYACPSSPAFIHASAKVQVVVPAETCDAVKSEMLARVQGQFGAWHDPHNNGTYSITSDAGGQIALQRLTGDKKYTDKMTIVLQNTTSGCTLFGCSESQTTSILDFGTNYCNLRMLYCGSTDGCKPVLHDFASVEKSATASSGTKDLQKCLKV